MKNSSSSGLIKVPSFIFQIYNLDEKNFIQKIYIAILGKLSQIVIKKFDNKVFCLFMNFLFGKYAKVKFDESRKAYIKTLNNNLVISYPNKRVTRTFHSDKNSIFNILYETYCLDYIDFNDGDVIIDCGANVGELNYAFYLRNLNIQYIGIEPDFETFECLKTNILRKDDIFHNVALSNRNGTSDLYLDSFGGNSSLEYFGESKFIQVETKTIESIVNKKNIKLFKVEAEGHEPEILEGATNILEKIEYISVDFGFERGIEQNSTIEDVNKILIKNSFELIQISNYRHVGLYKNIKFL